MNYRNNNERGDWRGRQRLYCWAPCKDVSHSSKKILKNFGGVGLGNDRFIYEYHSGCNVENGLDET